MSKEDNLDKLNDLVRKHIFNDCSGYYFYEFSSDMADAYEIIKELDMAFFEMSRESVCKEIVFEVRCYNSLDLSEVFKAQSFYSMEEAICKVALKVKGIKL